MLLFAAERGNPAPPDHCSPFVDAFGNRVVNDAVKTASRYHRAEYIGIGLLDIPDHAVATAGGFQIVCS